MKFRIFYTLFFLVSTFKVYAGDSTFSWTAWRKTWPLEKLNTRNIPPQTDSNLIKRIDLVDMRSDTSCLGLYTTKSHHPHALVMDISLMELLNSKLANDSSGLSLLFVVRSLWVNETKLYNNFKNKVTIWGKKVTTTGGTDVAPTGTDSSLIAATKIKCAIDVFVLNEGSYYPLTRFDTVLLHRKKWSTAAEELVNATFYLLNKKITGSIYANRYKSRRAATKESIVENYQKDFHFPALTDTVIKKGVFYSWQQFKNNEPEETLFRIQENEKEPPILYLIDEKGNEILTRNVYALNDGKRTYKVHQGYVFDMYRDKRCIYWMGVEEMELKTKTIPLLNPVFPMTSPLPLGGGITHVAYGSKVKVQLTPFLLNRETGEGY